jgi:chemotaxis signal transduction protein
LISGDTRIVNVEIEDDGQWGSKVGMVVDALSEMLRVSDEDVAPPSPIVTTVTGDAASLTGTARANAGPAPSERLVILLDLAESL